MTTKSTGYLEEARLSFREYKLLGERAFEQLHPEDWLRQIDPESNSIAAIVKHMAGNMKSRWTDFLSSDGEKADRNRDQEFVLDHSTTPEHVLAWWNAGWQCVFDAVDPLTEEDLLRRVRIRGQEYTVLQGISRQIKHYCYHIGQIVFLAKHFRGADFKSLSIPKGKSTELGVDMEVDRYKPWGV